jgi:hypothetical protein
MTILYRRFLLVASFIAAMGAITANVIQETRTARVAPLNGLEQFNPATSVPCLDGRLCSTDPALVAMSVVLQG